MAPTFNRRSFLGVTVALAATTGFPRPAVAQGAPLTPSAVNFHAKLTRDLHRELTHQGVMFRGSGWGQGMYEVLLFPGCCGGTGLEAEAVVSGFKDVAAVGYTNSH